MVTQRIQNTIQAGNVFLFDLIARISRPLVLGGLIYWLAILFLHIPVIVWWPLAWSIIQIVTLDIHLVILPTVAYSYARRGARAKLIVTVVVLLGVVVSSFALWLGRTETVFTVIRVATLISLSSIGLDSYMDSPEVSKMNNTWRMMTAIMLLVIDLILDILYQMQTTAQSFRMPSLVALPLNMWQLIIVNVLVLGGALLILPRKSAM